MKTLREIEAMLEKAWEKFADIPMNPETECMEERFRDEELDFDFPAGTHREEIWKWFDDRYPKGVYHLLYGDCTEDKPTANPLNNRKEIIERQVLAYLETYYGWFSDSGFYAIRKDYLGRCLKSNEIAQALNDVRKCGDEAAFFDSIIILTDDTSGNEEYSVAYAIAEILEKEGVKFPMTGLNEPDISEVLDVMNEHCVFEQDQSRILSQKVSVNIFLDTGDGRTNFTANCLLGSSQTVPENASLLWLAKTQGYTADSVKNALADPNAAHSHRFLESVRHEVAALNASSSFTATLAFLVQMPIKDLIRLNAFIGKQNIGSVTIKRDATCGLVDLSDSAAEDCWHSFGGCLGIELERDVTIPIEFIKSALPDGCDGYKLSDVFNLSSAARKHNIVSINTRRK